MASGQRPQRQTKKAPTPFKPEAPHKKIWTLEEKKLLLAALKKHGVNEIPMIHEWYFKDRTLKELEHYIGSLSSYDKVGKILEVKRVPLKAPVEMWLRKAEDMTYHDVDYSYVLAQVTSIAGNLEPHPKKTNIRDPDYQLIYKFIVALLKGEEPPELNHIDAAIVLDLLQNLADHLKSLGTTDQRKLMRRKFELLSAYVNIYDKKETVHNVRKALEEDLLVTDSRGPVAVTSGSTISQSAGGASCSTTNQSESRTTISQSESNTNSISQSEAMTNPTSQSDSRLNPIAQSDSGAQNSNEQTVDKPVGLHRQASVQSVDTEDEPAKKKGRICGPRKKEEIILPKKTTLYSINPFCIPVKYLNPKPKIAETAPPGI